MRRKRREPKHKEKKHKKQLESALDLLDPFKNREERPEGMSISNNICLGAWEGPYMTNKRFCEAHIELGGAKDMVKVLKPRKPFYYLNIEEKKNPVIKCKWQSGLNGMCPVRTTWRLQDGKSTLKIPAQQRRKF